MLAHMGFLTLTQDGVLHGAQDQPSSYKTKACRSYARTGRCPYGPRCRFMHGDVMEAQHLAAMRLADERPAFSSSDVRVIEGSLKPSPSGYQSAQVSAVQGMPSAQGMTPPQGMTPTQGIGAPSFATPGIAGVPLQQGMPAQGMTALGAPAVATVIITDAWKMAGETKTMKMS